MTPQELKQTLDQHDRQQAAKQQRKKQYKQRKAASEFETVQKHAVEFYYKVIRPRYPDSILEVNPFADMHFGKHKINSMPASQWVMVQAKRAGWERGKPDIVITQKLSLDGKIYNGVALELKRDGEKVYRQDGELYANEHLREQQAWLDRYQKQGYIASFSIGPDETLGRLKDYFQL